MLFSDLERFGNGLSFEDLVACRAENLDDGLPQSRFVIHNENGGAVANIHCGLRWRGIARCRDGRLNQREVELEPCAFSRGTHHTNMAIALLDDSVDGGKTQPSPFPRRLGGEEWLEELSTRLFIDAGAGVAHFKDYPVPWKRG